MAHLLLIFTTLILLPFSISSQSTRNMTVGSSITASENSTSWVSPSGDFAFGFQQLKNNNSLFVLSIWFAKIPDKTIAWFERTSYPVPVNSVLTVDATFGLVLRDPQGKLLYSASRLSATADHAFMSNTGNFIVSQSNTTALWESFNSPSDTILPSQKIEVNGSALISKNSDTDFTAGKFSGRMNSDGNLVLETKSVITNKAYDKEYYRSKLVSGGSRLVFNEIPASISVVSESGWPVGNSTLLSSSVSTSDYYVRVTLGSGNGALSLSRFPKNYTTGSVWVSEGSIS